MSKNGFFSDVTVGPVRVVECSLWTNPDGPGANMTTNTNIELSNPAIQTNPTTGEKFSDMSLTTSIFYSDDDQAKVPRINLSVKLNARVSSAELTDHTARMAAISYLYPQASAYLSQLGAMGQVNGIALMAVDTEALVDVLESAAQA